ncbi:MAG: large conductance mechanosensitive channel protein MscL, partial [Ruminococcus sp.]|nr:large conductance mechanosensitive channel protein MscL [Ruminococcus sp.]
MKIVKEFKEFIMRGNVMDLAVGVIIGGAFGAIVTSLTDDIISPILGIFGGMDFSDLVLDINGAHIAYGKFITAVINFLIMALIIFLLVKAVTDAKLYTPLVARELRIKESDIALLRIVKRSVDARRGALKVNLSLEAYIDKEEQPKPLNFDYPSVVGKPEVIIVGAGPAGLYCALRLIELGFKPILFERGKEVVERGKDIAKIQRNQGVNPDSNYAFGEGGAGTFSDGKLFTRSKKRGDYNRALQRLVFHGASPEILYEAHPHIGSDRLPRIIANMRDAIRAAGGEVHFEKRVEELIVRNGRVEGVVAGGDKVEARAVVIATGHSARDIYYMLHRSGVRLEA